MAMRVSLILGACSKEEKKTIAVKCLEPVGETCRNPRLNPAK